MIVDHAMRYGRPAIAERIDALKAAGCERILIAPLYPQYCAATTATANDEAFFHLRRMRWQPAMRTLPPYYDDPIYIAALKSRLEEALAALSFEPQAILASFHGMPQRTLELGDPYHCHCQKTARLLAEATGPGADRHLPVPLRPREMAGACDRRYARRSSRPRHHPRRSLRPRLRRRLPGDAGGARRSAAAPRSLPPAVPSSPIFPASTTVLQGSKCCAA